VFERFTDRARRVVVLAQTEARLLRHHYIGTEHLLLGMIQEGEGVAAIALRAMGVDLEQVRAGVLAIVGPGEDPDPPTGHIPFTPRAKKVMELSLREALALEHRYIGTEHLLLGLIREGEGVAAQVLLRQGLTLAVVRQEVVGLLVATGPAEAAAAGGAEPDRAADPSGRPRRGGPAWRVERIRSGPRARRDKGEPERPPKCPRCEADLNESARYRVRDVPSAAGDDSPARASAFLYCADCGHVLAANPLED
jgi:Clp amino terminal domain, pathogenicity island component